ncbi:hypothetical protein CAPTEDRAFT_112715 [Capitella teleta]|uniref:Cell division cycle protein 16 homolog n=1 Tax=Capitella teleta TaxID=283909 RepID=R7V5Y0_CAPTE|nr:hypothetical protein CAPTEDRAFT_112715 [Capitella teleta]|eukprot:ELU11736.1 hypothetical protein CAPTEDRAFT_112715 [Capitella teleta]
MAELKSEKAQIPCNINKLRSLVRSYIEKHQYESALFWANKLVTLTNNEALDVYWYAQTLYLTRQYHRATHLLKVHQLEKKIMCCRYLAARCHFDCKEFQEALDILDCPTECSEEVFSSAELTGTTMKSSINLLRGKIYEAMENRSLASECFKEALQSDVFCYEAYECLTAHHMLSSQEGLSIFKFQQILCNSSYIFHRNRIVRFVTL